MEFVTVEGWGEGEDREADQTRLKNVLYIDLILLAKRMGERKTMVLK